MGLLLLDEPPELLGDIVHRKWYTRLGLIPVAISVAH